MRGGIVEDRDGGQERRPVEIRVLDERGGAGLGERRRVGPLVPAACGYGTTTIGRPSAVDLGEGRRAGAADDEVGRRKRRRASPRAGTATGR